MKASVLIEVLSPSTADYDRGKKLELYREIASLKDYVLGAQRFGARRAFRAAGRCELDFPRIPWPRSRHFHRFDRLHHSTRGCLRGRVRIGELERARPRNEH